VIVGSAEDWNITDFGPGSNFVIAMHTGLEARILAPLEVDVAPLQRYDLADSQSTFTAQQGDHSRICCMMP
jgi:hypothetical protein